MNAVVRFLIDCLIQLAAIFVMLVAWDCWPSGRGWPRFVVGAIALAVYSAVERSQERRKSNAKVRVSE